MKTCLNDCGRLPGEREPGRVYVRADAEIPYGRAAEVLGALNVSGYRDVGLVMSTEVPVPQPGDVP